MAHPKEKSAETLEAFNKLVPSARQLGNAVYELTVADQKGTVRVKRAAQNANQVQVWRGEPLVIHVPSEEPDSDEWFVVPIDWQLTYARKHAKTAAQHASHAFDCMMFRTVELDLQHRVHPGGLLLACEQAVLKSRNPMIRIMVKAIKRTRDAVADVLIDTLQEELEGSQHDGSA